MAQILEGITAPPLIAKSHMCFEKPLMMWLFETHVASQRSPLLELETTYDGELSEPYG